MIERLPDELLIEVLDFRDVPSRIHLARGNKALQQRVYRDCSQAWETIDFSELTDKQTESITDAALSILLSRVNAKDVTKHLSLESCSAIRGNGIIPLQGSRVLESVRLTGALVDKNPAPLLSILQMCIPYKLVFVKLTETAYASDIAKEFTRHLRQAKLLQAQDQGTLCARCQEPVADPSQQVVPDIQGLPLHRCLSCSNDFCRGGNCPVNVRECSDCTNTCCSECDDIFQCGFCLKSFCTFYCDGEDFCDECIRLFCTNCYENHDCPLECRICGETRVCYECSNNRHECENEDSRICDDCWLNKPCSVCNDHICYICNLGAKCESCSTVVCNNAECSQNVQVCGAPSCEKGFCTNCAVTQRDVTAAMKFIARSIAWTARSVACVTVSHV